MVNTGSVSAKKYWNPIYHIYDISGHNFEFRCQYYETKSYWGHKVQLIMDGSLINTIEMPSKEIKDEMFPYQTVILKSLKLYIDAVAQSLVKKYRIEQRDKMLASNTWYKMVQQLYRDIAAGDRGTVELSK